MAKFQKGQSGNPGGRPKGTSLTAELRRMMDEKAGADSKITRRRALLESLYAMALKGDVRAHAIIWDRTEGKAIASDDDGEKLPVFFTLHTDDQAPENAGH